MYILVDTETSGKPLDYKAPPSDFNAWGTARMAKLVKPLLEHLLEVIV
jgi:hypothetical protein